MSSAAAPNDGSAGPPPSSKKRRLYEVPPSNSEQQPHNLSKASDLQVLHQTTELSLLYMRHPQTSWHCKGRTSLYLINQASPESSNNNRNDFAMHLRGSCQVKDLTVETLQRNNLPATNDSGPDPMDIDDEGSPPPDVSLVSMPVSFQHDDPLTHVLVKPAAFTEGGGDDDNDELLRFDADSQWIRGASGMTNGLRAASIASLMGELRISCSSSNNGPGADSVNQQQQQQQQQQPHPQQGEAGTISSEEAKAFWKRELQDFNEKEGIVARKLATKLYSRSTRAREARVELIARTLADASVPSAPGGDKDGGGTIRNSKAKHVAMKVTIVYEVLLNRMPHLAGIHSSHDTQTPHVYTTTGILGDHEGPRSWIPCLDSASSKHRASHELVLKVTAPMRDGLSVVGCGQDFGLSKTMLHDMMMPPTAVEHLGTSHVHMVNDTVRRAHSRNAEKSQEGSAPHVIPPDKASIDSVLATTTWTSQIWTPSPIRSIGFAVGPFKILEDPEYFSEGNDDDDDVEDGNETDQSAFVESARENGEGIRQAYFAPLYERKYMHLNADMRLLYNTTFELPALGPRFVEASQDLDQAVIVSTVGVPLRTLTLLRDVLALPTYRTASYTQVWIPNAVHGGSTSGALHCCPDVLVNPFLGGSIMDARLLSPVGSRLPYYNGGRVLQMMQARNVIRGWITAAIPLGEYDDVGFGYIHTLAENFLVSIYERGNGAYGEGGAKNGVFFSKRYASRSGLNSSALDFLPVANIEEGELDALVGGLIGAVPIEDRNSDQLWRTASNGTESHTSALDELGVRQVLYKDSVEALERATGSEKEKDVPLPSVGYMGSHLSLSFLTSNSSSSSELGCGALDLLHPVGGMTYRSLKSEILRRVVEGRAGVANFIRLIRAAFIAAHLEDIGKTEIQDEEWQAKPKHKKAQDKSKHEGREQSAEHSPKTRPPFLLCVDELLKKHGLTHALFTRALRILAGPMREPHLRGTLVDVERETRMPGNGRHYVEPESFPNSYVRGASELYLRVGAHVEPAGATDGASGHAASSAPKGTQLHILAEPVIPKGGIAFGGPITVRVVENEGQLREFVRSITADGSRCDWGPIFLHAKPVTTAKQQTAASGTVEANRGSKLSKADDGSASASASDVGSKPLGSMSSNVVFTDAFLHKGGYQSIELVRLTNRTPLLWVRVDPMGIYGGRISIVQPDACAAEQLFHDGDAGAQVDALRALAERPLRIQGSVKITTVYDADVSELPVRVLGDCLRGSPALHSSLPHTPAVRVQAALGIAQWQNNKASVGKVSGKADVWIGLKLLLQYFRERFYDDGIIVPVSFTRVAVKKSEDMLGQGASKDASAGIPKTGDDALYQYLDTVDPHDRRSAINDADDIEIEEDEEYRVRSAVVQAIASIRGENGSTPSAVLRFLEEVLVAGDCSMVGSSLFGGKDLDHQELIVKADRDKKQRDLVSLQKVAALSYVPSIIVADGLLSLCSVNASDELTTDVDKSKAAEHPVLPLILTSHRWLQWELYRETIRSEAEASSLCGVGGSTHSTVAACAITALYSLCILKQSTTDPDRVDDSRTLSAGSSISQSEDVCDVASSAEFYKDIFDSKPLRDDVTRAACAQAVACMCCAADRIELNSREPIGLLNALEFLLERIIDISTSPGLRQTLALLMMDACTGKICSMQRVGSVGGRGDLCTSAARLLTGPLGASYGGDNGSAILMTVNEFSYPAANAVNDGARRGLVLLKRAGGIKDETTSNQTIARVARFATLLWRTVNGDNAPPPSAASPFASKESCGVCAFDGQLRCSLLSVLQWLWPAKFCSAVTRVQAWEQLMGADQFKELGADLVMRISETERDAANAEEDVLVAIKQIVEKEIDRQRWRGEMASKAYEYYQYDKSRKAPSDVSVNNDTGTGQPLPVVKRDDAFKQGGWVASASQQRRAAMLDGGPRGTKVRLKMKSSSGD